MISKFNKMSSNNYDKIGTCVFKNNSVLTVHDGGCVKYNLIRKSINRFSNIELV